MERHWFGDVTNMVRISNWFHAMNQRMLEWNIGGLSLICFGMWFCAKPQHNFSTLPRRGTLLVLDFKVPLISPVQFPNGVETMLVSFPRCKRNVIIDELFVRGGVSSATHNTHVDCRHDDENRLSLAMRPTMPIYIDVNAPAPTSSTPATPIALLFFKKKTVIEKTTAEKITFRSNQHHFENSIDRSNNACISMWSSQHRIFMRLS